MQEELIDDPELLDLILADGGDADPIYRPGPYWERRTKDATAQLRRRGFADFRGDSSTVCLSYGDCVHVDVRQQLVKDPLRGILRTILTHAWPVSAMFDAQVALTRSHADQARLFRGRCLASNPVVGKLLERYRLPAISTLGGCVETVSLGGCEVSMHYLLLLGRHDHLARRMNFSQCRTVVEIGGGFGAELHLLLENYPNIRKAVYVDIPPNLYVGTQYLRAFFGKAVVDYRATRKQSQLEFRSDDSLEILCIAPWQFARVNAAVDLFYNANSFVEMPRAAVQRYAELIARLDPDATAVVALVSYDEHDPSTTFDPRCLPGFFGSGRRFSESFCTVLDGAYQLICFISDQPSPRCNVLTRAVYSPGVGVAVLEQLEKTRFTRLIETARDAAEGTVKPEAPIALGDVLRSRIVAGSSGHPSRQRRTGEIR